MVYKTYDVKRIASECGIHWKTIDKIIRQAEKHFPEWDWQEDFDWQTHCSEIRDYGEREKELKRRLNLPLETEKEISIEMEKEKEEEIEWLLSSKEGVKQLLSRVYKDSLTKKQKIDLKEKLLNRPELATLIALYNGEEQDYAKRYLAEMVVAPTRKDVKDLLKADTLKIHSSKGWIKSINNVPVKSLRSIDLIKEIEGYEHIASEKADVGTIAIYRRGAIPEAIPVKPVRTYIPPPVEKPEVIKKPVEPLPPKPVEKPVAKIEPVVEKTLSEGIVDDYALPTSQMATGGKPIEKEYCFTCGRLVSTDEYADTVNSTNVYFCSEHCYQMRLHPPRVMPKTGMGQTVGWKGEGEIRRKITPRKWVSAKVVPKQVEKPAEAVSMPPVAEIDELIIKYSYGEILAMAKQHNIQSGPKVKMVTKLIEKSIL